MTWNVGCWVTLPVILWPRPTLQCRGVAKLLHSILTFLLRWSELQCQLSSGTWKDRIWWSLFCHLLCENLDPQGRPKRDKYLTREAAELNRKAKSCAAVIQQGTGIWNLGLGKRPWSLCVAYCWDLTNWNARAWMTWFGFAWRVI